MPKQNPLGDYLRARRDALRPVEGDGRTERRVPGLRREEVAEAAGISFEYYVRLEQGRGHRPSDQVLLALGAALQLDANGMKYLFALASAAPRRAEETDIAPLLGLLEHWSDTPAVVFDRNQDIVAMNPLAQLLFEHELAVGSNLVEAVFARRSERRTERWFSTARAVTAALRFHADPYGLRLQQIVERLSAADADFRAIWRSHDAAPLSHGVAESHVRGFGAIDFAWQVLEVPTGHFLQLTFARPGSRADALSYLCGRGPVEAVTA
jgi:transcriptional regulator with XRE-family HTH domain